MVTTKEQADPRYQSFMDGCRAVLHHAVFRAMTDDHFGTDRLTVTWSEDLELVRQRGWARVSPNGSITVNKNARLTVEEWTWVIGHCALHLGFGHLEPGRSRETPSIAAECLVVTRFQRQLRLGIPPLYVPPDLPGADDHHLAGVWRAGGIPPQFASLGCAGAGSDHQPGSLPAAQRDKGSLSWMDRFAVGLANAAAGAVRHAGEVAARSRDQLDPDNPWEQARRWFVTEFPLLGALAAGFRIVADAELARSLCISVAAVDAELAEIYVNPMCVLTAGERCFVLAHEMLHAALRHGERVGPRDPYLWNVAADFVVNGWLVELGVGEMPERCLYDPALKGRGAEDVYHEIASNLRRARKLATLRGQGLGDMIARPTPAAGEAARAGDLDDFYRRALIGGLARHQKGTRGLVPAGLVEEIRVLEHPPPPWDVQLAQWFDRYFSPLEAFRTYARPSRRQASTPDIPRAGRYRPEIPVRERTFGVVLDTSGSMDRGLLGKALGAIAAYAAARDVPAARVVFCDAVAYDAGYLEVDQIAGRVRVRGRGGTELQPGINLLESTDDFPADGPILVITDGECDVVRIRREHAFLIPRGARLPFAPRGEVFYIK